GLRQLAAAMANLRMLRRSPFSEDERRRIALTVAVRDTDVIPKVLGAGGLTIRDGVRVQMMHNGVVVREGCYHGRWMTEIIRLLRGHHEPQEELAFYTILKRLSADTPAPTMVELRSFWASYSLWAKREIPSIHLILLEPDEANLDVGKENLRLNGMEGSVVHAAAGREHDVPVTLTWESDGQPPSTRQVSVDGLMRDFD